MVQYIPTEIVIAFGELFDGPSLFASLLVCRQWYTALHPYAWISITKRQWVHPSFPINQSTRLFQPFQTVAEEMNAARILSHLRLTQSLEWNDIRVPRRLRAGAPSSDSSHTPPPPPTLAPVVFPNFAILFRLMPHLSRVSLSFATDEHAHNVFVSVLNPTNLQNLQALCLDLPQIYPPMAIEKLYPLISRLEELDLRGKWFIEADPDATIYPSHAPWNLKRLTVNRIFISFLGYCPLLETLSFKHPMSLYGLRPHRARGLMLPPLLRMSNLKTITLGRTADLKEDEFRIQEPIGPAGDLSLWEKKTPEDTREKDWTLHVILDYLL
ncbi:MAG: hypothetical protein J3R72DRAFT_22096 [Linnemannia gamsii]|nr:MAG: hypothetical protein J3R72DRAFT_22096 [Linnemannia gamsii]